MTYTSNNIRREKEGNMELFKHLIYEYKKGVKDLALYTCESSDKQILTEILQKMKIQYHIDNLGEGKINIYFGSNPCLKIIRGFSSKNLDRLTPYEDFILGIMLGYSRNEQYNRLLGKITPQKTCW